MLNYKLLIHRIKLKQLYSNILYKEIIVDSQVQEMLIQEHCNLILIGLCPLTFFNYFIKIIF